MASIATPLVGGVRSLGRSGLGAVHHAGGLGLLAWRSAAALLSGRVRLRDVAAQAYESGVGSLPLVLVTAVLSGVVTTQQGGYQLTSTIPLYVLGSVVTSSVVLELGPVLTAIVLIGRVGARIAAEIGTMQVSEQIDALRSLGRDPVAVLAAPRLFGTALAMPALVAVANAVGVGAGMVAAGISLGLGPESFLYGARLFWHSYDLFYSLMKALCFGFVIPLIAIHMGFQTRGGAEGVGRAATSAVVAMILAVLVSDAVFPPLFLN